MFPPQDRDQICLRLSGSMRGVVSQKLLPRADGTGRVGAIEIMIATPTIAKLLEEGRASQLPAAIAEGNFWGMQTMNQCLLKYFKAGLITEEEAIHNAGNVTEMKQMVRRP
jgi:twitching motility protein PilT